MSSPTALTMDWLRSEGWKPWIVERWIPGANIRRDMFGFADLVAIRADQHGVWALQPTTSEHVPDHLRKCTAIPDLKTWLMAGNTFSIVGWSLRQAKEPTLFGQRKHGRELWTPRWVPVRLEDLVKLEDRSGPERIGTYSAKILADAAAVQAKRGAHE